jgi:DNA-directed RNA polymerase specialized sigma24 family protein
MQPEDAFDAFYSSTRRGLLQQTLALTGDPRAAEAAVRNAYTGAWQHWRKVSRLDDPLDWVRPRAWRQAQRRHTARVRRRHRDPAPGHQAVLSALAGLPAPQRRVLLLVELAGLDAASAAAELGSTQDAAERDLRAGTEALAARLDLPEDRLGEPLRSLDQPVDRITLPRPSIVRGSGRKRRHRHLLVGTAAAAALALGAGAAAYEPGAAGRTPSAATSPTSSASGSASPSVDPRATPVTADDLLDGRQLRGLAGPRPWRVDGTGTNTTGNGINSVCQQDRFADPQGLSAIVRASHTVGQPRRTAVQTVELSRSVRQARAGFRTAVGWFAGCQVARVQVLDAHRVAGLGDEAQLLTVRMWKRPVRTVSVAVARTGTITTSTVTTTVGSAPPPVGRVTGSLADAVRQLCIRAGAGACVAGERARAVPPPPSGEPPGVLAVADLPPAGAIDRPWVGTRTARPARNPSATTCDRSAFTSAGARAVRARTYLVPQARLPARFGLSETYGVFGSAKAAAGFLAGVRAEVAGCEKRDLATQVSPERRTTTGRADASRWDLTTKVSEQDEVRFRLGFVRVGARVAQLTFAPVDGGDMTQAAFDALVTRAGDRLRQLP